MKMTKNWDCGEARTKKDKKQSTAAVLTRGHGHLTEHRTGEDHAQMLIWVEVSKIELI